MNDQHQKHEFFECVIIGGGIVGAGLFRDLSLNNVSVLIIDQKDFMSETSSKSSKMLHGGIRYLENLDFHLVFEALHEKNFWLKMAPHLCYEARFHLPLFKSSKDSPFLIKLGLFLYDLLSLFKNTPHKMINAHELDAANKLVDFSQIRKIGIYSDAIVDDVKLGLESIFDGLFGHQSNKNLWQKKPGVDARNYHQFIKYETDPKTHHKILHLKNILKNETYTVQCKHLIFALGPFTDLWFKDNKQDFHPFLRPSKGSHLWIKKSALPVNDPFVIRTKDERIIFIIPQQNMILVGTTEIPSTDRDIVNPQMSSEEKYYLLNNINEFFPKTKINDDDILGDFSGIRPLVRAQDQDLKKTSREHQFKMLDQSTFVIAGGKYTTFRVMGQEISRIICLQLNKTYAPMLSESKLHFKSTILPFEEKISLNYGPTAEQIENILKNELVQTFDDLVSRRLGIISKRMWMYKYSIDFDQYFNDHFELINKYIKLDKKTIEQFKN